MRLVVPVSCVVLRVGPFGSQWEWQPCHRRLRRDLVSIEPLSGWWMYNVKRYPHGVPKKAPKTSRGDTSGAYRYTISVLYTSRRKAMFDLPEATVTH